MPIVTSSVKAGFAYKTGMSRDAERQKIIEGLIASLRRRREKLGLSLNETAWRAGLSHTMVMRMEKRERLPTIDTLLRVAGALEADLGKLLIEAERAARKPQR